VRGCVAISRLAKNAARGANLSRRDGTCQFHSKAMSLKIDGLVVSWATGVLAQK
jgi:hypothetical protein